MAYQKLRADGIILDRKKHFKFSYSGDYCTSRQSYHKVLMCHIFLQPNHTLPYSMTDLHSFLLSTSLHTCMCVSVCRCTVYTNCMYVYFHYFPQFFLYCALFLSEKESKLLDVNCCCVMTGPQ